MDIKNEFKMLMHIVIPTSAAALIFFKSYTEFYGTISEKTIDEKKNEILLLGIYFYNDIKTNIYNGKNGRRFYFTKRL